jgi:hypothetical protein
MAGVFFARFRCRARASRRLAASCEPLECRTVPAHLATFTGAAAAIAKAGNFSDSHAVSLGDSNIPGPSSSDRIQSLASTKSDISYISSADVKFTWSNTPATKILLMDGSVALQSGQAGEVHFGSNGTASTDGTGGLITLNIEPDAGEVAGTPINVTITSYAGYSGASESGSATGSYTIRYANEQDGPFVQTLDSGNVPASADKTQSVTVRAAIGKTVSFGFSGEFNVSSGWGILGLQASVALGPKGQPPGDGGDHSPTSSALTIVRSATAQTGSTSTKAIIVTFSGPLDPASASDPGNHRVQAARGHARIRVISATYDPATNSVKLGLSRPLAKGEHAVVTVVGSGIKDQGGKKVDGDQDANEGGDYTATVIGAISRNSVKARKHRHS